MTKNILFVCVHNSGRSQMAAAFARNYGGPDVAVESAGAMPTKQVNPVVVEAMREKGIDISAAKPKLLTEEMADRADPGHHHGMLH